MADDFGFFSSSESGAPEAAEEDPAAAFLAQQESEIAGIENDEGFGAPAGSQGASRSRDPPVGLLRTWGPRSMEMCFRRPTVPRMAMLQSPRRTG